MAESRRHLQREPLGQCLEQCRDGMLLLLAEERANGTQVVSDKGCSQSQYVRLYQALLQSNWLLQLKLV